jgi:hypothetical protein
LKDIYETGTPYQGVSQFHKLFQNLLVLFSVKPIEYRYNNLLTHKSHTGGLPLKPKRHIVDRQLSVPLGQSADVQGAKVQKKYQRQGKSVEKDLKDSKFVCIFAKYM